MSNSTKVFSVFVIILLVSQFAMAGRYYHAATGRFLSVDQLADKYPSWSPYSYTFNNPINYIDPDGKEPNKSQATSPKQFISFVQSHYKGSASATLAFLGNYETLGGNDPSHKRYIYTREGGWIDLVHFFNVAAEIGKLSTTKKIGAFIAGGFALWEETKNIENKQVAQGSIGTAWSYEDAPSNYLGFIFWKHYYDPNGDLVEQIIEFLKEYGAVDPEKAPNWKEMWNSENWKKQQFPQNKSFFPDFTSDKEEDDDDWWDEYDPSKH